MSDNIFYVCGYHATGKTELSKWLAGRENCSFIETGDVVRDLYSARMPELSALSLTEYVEHQESERPGYFSEQIVRLTNQLPDELDIIVNGMRSAKYILQLKERLPESRHMVIWIDSPRDALQERYVKREGVEVNQNSFEELLQIDERLGIESLREIADFVLKNDRNIEYLFQQAQELMERTHLETLRDGIGFQK